MPLCLLGLGSNLGEPARFLDDALAKLAASTGVELVRGSRYIESAPAGGPPDQPTFLNAAALVRTSLSPQELLRICHEIENSLDRRRDIHWGPRTIDIDLLLYDDLVLNSADLQIPHPRMAWRRFVLEPAAEIAADLVHPVIRWTMGRLLKNLNSTPWYLAIDGSPASGKRELAAELSQRLGARLIVDPAGPTDWAAFYRNPSSQAWHIQLEFLSNQARLLDPADAVWRSTPQLTISDFWFEQSLALTCSSLPPEPNTDYKDQFSKYFDRWAELRQLSVRPRLRVLVRTPPEAFQAYISISSASDDKGLTAKLLQQMERSLIRFSKDQHGPILRLDSIDQPDAMAELTAAVEAMR